MKRVICLSAALALLTLVLIAGCASTDTAAPVTPAMITPDSTTVPTAEPVPSTTIATPTATITSGDNGPIEVMPTDQQVTFELSKDRPTSKIYLTYQGGAGERFTQKVTMKVYASDGSVEEYVMSSGQKPAPNDQIIAPGTRGGDRCIVYVQSGSGTIYKVMDQKVFGSADYL